MIKQNEELGNPLTPDLAQIETLSRTYVVNNRRTLRPVERVIRQDPETSRELDRAGGFSSLLTRGRDQVLERDFLSRFSNIQTSLFVDRVTQGDLYKTPALETMHETSRENNKILTAIATELNGCCEEIKNKLDDLDAYIRSSFRRLRDLLISDFTELQTELNDRFDNVEVLIDQAITSIKTKITEQSNEIVDKLKSELNSKKQEIIDRIRSFINALQEHVDRSFTTLLEEIVEALTAQSSVIIEGLELFYELTIQPVVVGIATGVGEIATTTGYLSYTVNRNYSLLKRFPSELDSALNKQFDRLKEFLNEWKKDLIVELAEEVSLHIVGESYYKWDSVSTYFPTLTFLFKETQTTQYPRRSQIKIRLKKTNKDITDQDVNLLKSKCSKLLNQTYFYGENRFNYVSSDKRFKTTLFGSDTKEIENLLTNLLFVIDDPFNKKNLSLTINRNRQNLTKRQISLDSIKPNETDYKTRFPLQLFKIVLMVNGLNQPIILAKN